MITKQLALRFKIRTFIVMHYLFTDFGIKDLKKEYELGKISKDYLDGYLRGVTDFKDNLIKADMSIIK